MSEVGTARDSSSWTIDQALASPHDRHQRRPRLPRHDASARRHAALRDAGARRAGADPDPRRAERRAAARARTSDRRSPRDRGRHRDRRLDTAPRAGAAGRGRARLVRDRSGAPCGCAALSGPGRAGSRCRPSAPRRARRTRGADGPLRPRVPRWSEGRVRGLSGARRPPAAARWARGGRQRADVRHGCGEPQRRPLDRRADRAGARIQRATARPSAARRDDHAGRRWDRARGAPPQQQARADPELPRTAGCLPARLDGRRRGYYEAGGLLPEGRRLGDPWRVRVQPGHESGGRTVGGVLRCPDMGRLIYSAIASLDGYVADERGAFDWAAPDDEVHRFVNELERPVGTYLYGRRMYEVMVAWETMPTSADQSPVVRDFAELWRAAEKVVYSTTLETATSARTRIERTFDPEAVGRLKARAEADVTVGGPDLAGQALAAGLVDEVQLFLSPVAVGGGKQALPGGVHVELELLDERRFDNGMVYLRYRHAH